MSSMKKPGPWRWLLCYGMWIVLSILVGVVAWYVHTTILYLALQLVEHPTWRPTGWSTDSLAGVARLSIFALGSAWLMIALWMEGALRRSLLEGRFWSFAARLTVVVGIVWAICYGILAL